MRSLLRFVALPWRQKRLCLAVAFWLATVKAALHVVPFGWLVDRIRRFGRPRGDPIDHVEMQVIVRAVERVSQALAVLHIDCLPQALVAQRLLQINGIATQLRIGVYRDRTGRLAGHAWLEGDGRVVLGNLPDMARFTPFPSLDAAMR